MGENWFLQNKSYWGTKSKTPTNTCNKAKLESKLPSDHRTVFYTVESHSGSHHSMRNPLPLSNTVLSAFPWTSLFGPNSIPATGLLLSRFSRAVQGGRGELACRCQGSLLSATRSDCYAPLQNCLKTKRTAKWGKPLGMRRKSERVGPSSQNNPFLN